jgi:excisionase family DNA binding protein
MKEKSLTTKDIAGYCQVTQRTAVQWINEGKLKFFRTPGKHIRVSREDFVAFLKTYNMPVPRDLEPSAEADSRAKRRVLIVDDDREMVDAIARILRNEKMYDLEAAYDGFEAGQKFMTRKPDLVILDVRMPRVDGYKLCSAIRNSPENRDVKILIVSGLVGEKDRQMIKKLGADDYLAKPFSGQDLKTKIADLLGGG